ncbi:Receptor-like protein kinase ANXUR2, partial [Mucuna pruriens]
MGNPTKQSVSSRIKLSYPASFVTLFLYSWLHGYGASHVTDKTDVYSFGIVLLKVVYGGKYVKMEAETEFLEKHVEEKIDPNMKGKIAPECWQRATMGEVEVELEHALALQEQAHITNTNVHYNQLSKTIINRIPAREFEHPLSLHQEEDITEDSDSEDMFP